MHYRSIVRAVYMRSAVQQVLVIYSVGTLKSQKLSESSSMCEKQAGRIKKNASAKCLQAV